MDIFLLGFRPDERKLPTEEIVDLELPHAAFLSLTKMRQLDHARKNSKLEKTTLRKMTLSR